MSGYEEKWLELADIKDELAERDWFFGTSGNLSIRVTESPTTFLVTASGKDKRKRTNEDFLLVDQHGLSVEETGLKPSAETVLHTAIYEKTKAGCVLHVHTVDNNVVSELYGDQGKVVFTKQEIIKALGLWEEDAKVEIPIIPNFADLQKLGDVFEKHIKEDTGAVLIRNHGITVWGKTAFEAKRHLEAYEFLCSYLLKLKLFAKQIEFTN
ncbi:methylthioribulose 1-phosphate dehydratase [Priestia filamentosa]|uniref:methylthioribulose 1-phosphate dehydratase n=1 Tax=Priestia filamentosa TaxID=1402861 RepID=UPI0002D6BF93|nr:methylthioribulose 1-phosphate dehydratase [Priestia filamentosa]MDT3761576.1 methylthioribulose 1-phosphate dehydratase [Priestia filamentosa]OXS67676.1 methylthioribulose 1-phosphate dehydratase [Priestia filamentosa]RJS65120.1 methylthioribulose 1-phosphate dehydratase [Priestia filamentosa]WRU96100.1 methylthioribulose 1-phosphate dehydratase [Priestia filamentosa]SMF42675.1 methylthioribulose-1-phosphate dehydratase [Priestia filamentosa]